MDEKGWTALHLCGESNNKDAIKVAEELLKKDKRQIRRKDNDGKSPLGTALSYGNYEIATVWPPLGSANSATCSASLSVDKSSTLSRITCEVTLNTPT